MTIVNVNPEGSNDAEYLEKLAAAQTPAEMVQARNEWLIDHGARTLDNSGKLNLENFQNPDAADATTSGSVSRTVKLFGRDQTFTAGSLLELERQIGAAYTAANAWVESQGGQPRDAATGQFVSKPDPAELNPVDAYNLEMKMKRGEITVQQYLNQSGELARSFDQLAKDRLGLDPATVKETRFQNSWAGATQTFLDSEAGADWPGGNANREILGLKLAELGLVDAEDKVGALATACAHLKAEGKMQPNPELVKREKERFESATSAEEINAIARASLGMKPRQLWGQ